MSRRPTRWPLTSALQGSGHHARQRPLRIKGGAQLQSVRDGMRLGTAGDKFSAETTKRRIAVGLVLQLSLLVDQEFGGLSFPVAGFGDGLMEPAPERPSENEVDAELSWKRAMRRRISGMLKAMNAPDPSPPFGRRG